MAGMGRRGTHAARHRAGRPRGADAAAGSAATPVAVPEDAPDALASPVNQGDDLGTTDARMPVPMTPLPAEFPVAPPQAPVPQAPAPSERAGGGPASSTRSVAPEPGRQTPRQRTGRPRPGGRRKAQIIRLTSLLSAAAVVVAIGLAGVSSAAGPASDTVMSFLLAWQARNYPAAAALTTGRRADVVVEMRNAYAQLGADDLVLQMGRVTVRDHAAKAFFTATIDLGRGGLTWKYQGHFMLRPTSAGWRVLWSPSVIVPGLGPGDRLAVLTATPHRAALLDSEGVSLIRPSSVIQLGVVPGQVRDPGVTARRLARATGLLASEADEMSGQIRAAPPGSFLELIQLSPASYSRLRTALKSVPDLRVHRVVERLFDSRIPAITGQIRTETAKRLVEGGTPYRPGTTIGISGLEQAYQSKLAGSPTIKIVVQSGSGKTVEVLRTWPGDAVSPVRTTIVGSVQHAADQALAGLGYSASIVAVRAGGGQVLAVSQHKAGGMPMANTFAGQYQPGQSFTIVSTAALLSAVPGFGPGSPLPCYPTNLVGDQTFSNVPPVPGLGTQSSFRADFAHACGTAFAGASLRLGRDELQNTARDTFGVGGRWRLPIATFAGSMAAPVNTGQQAADVVGQGTVRVSPLGMALVAGAVDSGVWTPPSLVRSGQNVQSAPSVTLSKRIASQLRGLMAQTVASGAARAARLPKPDLYGQVGIAPVPGHRHLRAIWFVGFRGKVAFAAVAFSRGSAFTPAVQIARAFAAAMSSSALNSGS